MRKPDQGQISTLILGTFFFLLLFGTYASMFLVDRRSSHALQSILDTFHSFYESIQNRQLAEPVSGVQGNRPPVDMDAMDAAVGRFRELSAILWIPRSKSPAIIMDIAWNDWKLAEEKQIPAYYENRQLLQAIRLARSQLGELNRKSSDAFDLVIFLSGLLFSLGTAGSIAFYARLQQSRLKEEFAALNLQKALKSEDEIRRTIAMELHDDIAQDVAAARMLCERARNPGADTPSLIQRAALTLGEVNHKIRILCTELRPPALEELGLHEAIRSLCDTESERQAKTITFFAETAIPRLPGQVEGTLYRILREAIINAAKHTRDGAAEVRARVTHTGKGFRHLVLEVRDNGYDDTVSKTNLGYGLGLTSIKERAAQIGADLTIKIDPGGSLIRIMLVLEKEK